MTEGPSDLELRRRQFKGQMSTVHTRRQQAVCVRRAYKRYGTKNNPCVILDGLNMTVPKGCIYGLLGASGCGKTTLLNCIVGRKRLNAGELWVLGGTPGSKGSGVPGPRVGYMPQEIALYGEFTIRETLKYFGWISNMTTNEVEAKVDFFINFLMLPDADRQVKNLSGGQQRRVSLAATLLHEPELLILDEPTVGVDPLLRTNIWNHLVEITKHGRTTVIITTHYIDETRQAHLIGLMRGGYFLAEESPERLISQFSAESLEDVFLKLSVIQNMGKRRRSSILQGVTESIRVPELPGGAINDAAVLDDEVGEISGEFGDNISMTSRASRRVSIAPEPSVEFIQTDLPPEDKPHTPIGDYFKILKINHMRALVWKNFLWMWRNIPVMLFIIGLPVGQAILFCLSIGHEPFGLKISVVNNEINFPEEQCRQVFGCNSTKLSCNYLDFVAQNYSVNFEYQETEEEARKMVQKGNSWAVIVIAHNFSDAMRSRVEWGRDTPPEDILSSTINVYQDKSNENIATYLSRDLLFGFVDFLSSYLVSCEIDPKIAGLPIRWEQPIYGFEEPDFTNFAAPGVTLTIIFFMAVALTSGAMIMERNEGILERSLVNGISGPELLSSQIITQFVVILGQTVMVLLVAFVFFGLTQNGSWWVLFILTLLAGVCGMCFGFVVSCVCDNERSATYMALGSFLPIVMLCGIIWPIEAMNKYLKIISFVLPLTQATESLRCVLARGWGLANPVVYNGFISLTLWILIFLTISILVLKFKKG
ncbi:ABC transporter oskyddad [Leptinotarsa decemlineata]|uniref:ABC transporter oskyddad n=1 Tax=Leptinotarsa decemlineata TaxID=7539 RepID=UPI000C2534AA|nr:ABC transporter G family member 20 [Leptinotarsa decemlineata]XP_023014780.1 ABC transporter G family member 20 [Leptinotarsa decemlineata]XP_023014788.1 ABC transporter G family member 20 [Leptinotarsa decemlineata]